MRGRRDGTPRKSSTARRPSTSGRSGEVEAGEAAGPICESQLGVLTSEHAQRGFFPRRRKVRIPKR